MAEKRIFTQQPDIEEEKYDVTLRPTSLTEFIGQDRIKENLKVFIAAAKKRKEPLDHCLFYSPPGLGKTTLANIISNELGVNIRTTSGPVMERVGDLAALLTALAPGDVFFVDEIHRINRLVEEALYPAMEEFRLDIVLGQGPSAKTIRLPVPRFTLIGATTRAGLLTSPLRDRFGIVAHLDFYNLDELKQIVYRSARLLNIAIEDEACKIIANRSRGTPRIVNRILRRVRDFAEVKSDGTITTKIAEESLAALEIDSLGLDTMDIRILRMMIDKFGGGPVGVETIAVAVSEEVDSITDVYEPYLIQSGLIQRTPRGRVVTEHVYRHFNLTPPAKTPELF